MTIFEMIKDNLVTTRKIAESIITESATFESLGLDSLDAVDVMMTLEEQLGVDITSADNIKTLGDLVALIEKSKKNRK